MIGLRRTTSRSALLVIVGLIFTIFVSSARQSMAAEDEAAPELVGLSISPGVVDTSDGSVVMTVQVRITDDRAGFAFGNTTFSSASGSQSLSVAIFDTDRVSGTSLDGTYQRSVTLPAYSEQGTWTTNGFHLKDQADNLRELTPHDLTTAGPSHHL